jgi:hypothetical protein
MASKKSRRARRRRAQRVVAAPERVSTRKEERKVRADEPGRGTAIDLAEQYGYVYDDLKRIAILAGTMFAILILLSFVIR